MSHELEHADYGTGDKKLGTYLGGFVSCVVLTLIAFWVVLTGEFSKVLTFAVIYTAACLQFLIQLICFLRLNVATEQGRTNVMSLVFTSVVLITIIMGSLWIMANLHFNMMN